MKFTKEQIQELKTIDNIDDLLRIVKRLIYLSDIPYMNLSLNLAIKTSDMLDDMLDDMFQ